MSSNARGQVRRIFHLTAVVPDRDTVVGELRDVLGAAVLHTAEGVTFGVDMRRAMLWLGENLIEVIRLVGDSPFSASLSRFGGGFELPRAASRRRAHRRERLAANGIDVAVRYSDDMNATRTANTAGLPLQFTSQWCPMTRDEPRPRHRTPPFSGSSVWPSWAPSSTTRPWPPRPWPGSSGRPQSHTSQRTPRTGRRRGAG